MMPDDMSTASPSIAAQRDGEAPWDRDACETTARHDFLAAADRLIHLTSFQGYVGDDSVDLNLAHPVPVRVCSVIQREELYRWTDARMLDPCWNLTLTDPARDAVQRVFSEPFTSAWWYGPSLQVGSGRASPWDAAPVTERPDPPTQIAWEGDIATQPHRSWAWTGLRSRALAATDDAEVHDVWSRFMNRNEQRMFPQSICTGHDLVGENLGRHATSFTRALLSEQAEVLAVDYPEAPDAFRLGLGGDSLASTRLAAAWAQPTASFWQRSVALTWMRSCSRLHPGSPALRDGDLIDGILPLALDEQDRHGLRFPALEALADIGAAS
jgi:hypothetical protein